MDLNFRNLAGRITSELEPTPPAHVLKLQPYKPVSSLDAIRLNGKVVPYKLDWNEATISPSPKVADALAGFISGTSELYWYPDLAAGELRKALSGYTGVPEDNLLVTNGSDDALMLLCRTFLGEGAEVLVPVPTYTHFKVFAGAQNARIVELAEPDPFRKNIRHLSRSIGPQTKMLYLVSPNNPTGVVWEEEDISRLCMKHPHVLFVVDEAYYEFCGRSVIQLTQTYSNLAVTRTFSKAFGLAALRVGYVAAHPQVCDHLWRLHNPKSVNSMAQVGACAALSDLEWLDTYVTEVRNARRAFVTFLVNLGLEARETPANYMLLRVPDPDAFVHAMEERHVFIRDRSRMPRMKGFVRFSVGTEEQMADVGARVYDALLELGWA